MDTDAVLSLIRDVAAQVITPRFRALGAGEVMEKRPGDLVTVADREAEELITAALLADDPSVLVVGEEATASDPGLPSRLADAEHAFTVDPVDGTKNFVSGSPDHAVMVAELRSGRPVRAWIYQPEHDLAYVGERGGGVYRNGVRCEAPGAPDEAHLLKVATSVPRLEGRQGALDLVRTAWSCGVDYPWLVDGRVHGLLYARALAWDHAPGALLIEELGGVVRFLDGMPYDVAHSNRSGLLAAITPHVWDLTLPHMRSVDV